MRFSFLFFTLALIGITYAPAFAAEDTKVSAEKTMPTSRPAPYAITGEYAVFAGGFRTLKAIANIREEKGEYATYVTIETDGLLRRFAPWSGILTSVGRFTAAEKSGTAEDDAAYLRLPRLHSFDNIWRGTNKRTEQHYNENGVQDRTIVQEDGRPDEEKTPDEDLAIGSTDILSAALEVANIIYRSDSCNSRQAVYDGKRRFILEFREVEREVFEASKYSSYNGEAIKCVVEIIPDGGKWRDKKRGWMSIQEQSKEKGHPPYVWFGKLTADGHEGAYAPVKVQVKTSYGTLMLHLTDGTLRPIKPAAQPKAETDPRPDNGKDGSNNDSAPKK